MNKTLILVMCDVLVLSAMSLSSGGFDRGNHAPMEQIDVTKELATVRASAASAQQALDLEKARCKEAEANVAQLQEEVQKARQKEQEAQAEVAAEKMLRETVEADVKRVIDMAALAQQALDVEKAHCREVEANVVQLQEEVQKAKQKEQEAQAEIEKARNGEFSAKLDAEQARKEVAAARHDEKEALADAEKARESESRAKAEAKLARELAVSAQKAAADAEKALAIALKSSDDYKNEITNTVCLVSVALEGRNTALEPYYSPLIEQDGYVFVMAMCKEKELNEVKQIQVKVAESENVYEAPTVYCLRGDNRKLDIAFFELPGICATNRLSLGVENMGDYQFKISAQTGAIENISRIGPKLGSAFSDWWNFDAGDVCVDAKNRAILYLCTKRWGKKDQYDFSVNKKLEKYHGE